MDKFIYKGNLRDFKTFAEAGITKGTWNERAIKYFQHLGATANDFNTAYKQALAVGGFTPLQLFANGEQGAWYDPSDLTTLYQDSAGTTPVTADGDPVGLMLDKSKGLVLGPELVTNGTFDSDVNGWDTKDCIISSVNGKLLAQATSTDPAVYQTITTVPGSTYEITVVADPVNWTSGVSSYWLRAADSPPYGGIIVNKGIDKNAGGFSKLVFEARSTTTYVYINVGAFSDGVDDYFGFDNFSVREIPGNHASQSVRASRPIYRTDGTLHWLEFDGVDDSLVTPTISPGIDKAQFFVGLQKVVDTAAIVVEMESLANPGTAYLVSGQDLGAEYSSLSRGSASAGESQVSEINGIGFAPDTAVITATHDIAADLSRIRRNGVYGDDATGDKGDGDFLSYPIYIGSRGGSSLFFEGAIHGLIVRFGSNLDEQTIVQTEQYIAARTGVTLP